MTVTTKPGQDEIALSAPSDGDLCHSLEHLRAGRAAQVLVTFGELGTLFADDLWPECWHRSYPMCGPCWQATRHAAGRRRPALTVRGTAGPRARSRSGRHP